MTYELICSRAVALSAAPGETPDAAEAAQAVHQALRVCGYRDWAAVHLELYRRGRQVLIFARPEDT